MYVFRLGCNVVPTKNHILYHHHITSSAG